MPKLLLPLFLLAAIGLTVYLAQKPTDINPSAQETPPSGCEKVTPSRRLVQYKNCSDPSANCPTVTPLAVSPGENDKDPNYKFPPGTGPVVATYPLKETVWEFGSGWKVYGTKGPRSTVDGDRTEISKTRIDNPSASKSYYEIDNDRTADGEGRKIGYREQGGSAVVVEFAYSKQGINYQGIQGTTYDQSRSYMFVPTDPNSNTRCDGVSSTGSKSAGATCTKGTECQSGTCTNEKCDATGTKAGGSACTKAAECQSGTYTNNKCAGGTAATGRACDDDKDCASNRCRDNKCISATATKSPSPTPKSSSGGGTTASTAPAASSAPSASVPAASTPAASTPAGTVPVSLTKAEITNFKANFDAVSPRLGAASGSGNLQIVSNLASSELNSIVSQLPNCPDDANVGRCVDTNFRVRFDFAKTAARLSVFYGIFNSVQGICVKSDLGLTPLITSTSQSGTAGRVNLCNDTGSKVWRIFVPSQAEKFQPIVSTDTRFPANPTCATLPQDVLTHLRNAETLFNNETGFVQNTLCDGKTLVAPGGTF